MKWIATAVLAAGMLAGFAPAALAQANPVLGKTLTCGKLRAVFAQNGDVTLTTAGGAPQKGTLKVVQNPGFKNIKDLQVLDAGGKFLMHFQQESNGRYELEGERCQVK